MWPSYNFYASRQTAIAFLSTRMKAPDDDDFKKLILVMNYLWETRDLPLTLEADFVRQAERWIDVSYGTHHDMKIHAGGMMSLDKGAVYATSKRQRIITRSLAELAGITDVLLQVLWSHYFMESLFFPTHSTKLYQEHEHQISWQEWQSINQ